MLKIKPFIRSLQRAQKLHFFCDVKGPDRTSKQNRAQKTPQDFSQIDIRVGEITQCWKHLQSQTLYCQKIRVLKDPQIVLQIGSGLRKYVDLQNMKGKVIVMVNLKPRKLAGFESQGMVVCASTQDKLRCQIIVPDGQIGERIFLQNHQQLFCSTSLLPPLNPKKKVLEKVLQDLRTDQQGFVVWKGIKLRTKNNYLRSNLKNALVY